MFINHKLPLLCIFLFVMETIAIKIRTWYGQCWNYGLLTIYQVGMTEITKPEVSSIFISYIIFAFSMCLWEVKLVCQQPPPLWFSIHLSVTKTSISMSAISSSMIFLSVCQLQGQALACLKSTFHNFLSICQLQRYQEMM